MSNQARPASWAPVICLGAAIAVTLAALLWTIPSRNNPPFNASTALHCGDAVPKRGKLDFYRSYGGTGDVAILPGSTYQRVFRHRQQLPQRPNVQRDGTTYYHFETVDSSAKDYRVLCQPDARSPYTDAIYAVPSVSRVREPWPLFLAAVVGFPLLIVGALLGLTSRPHA